jgi:hypothetical protein
MISHRKASGARVCRRPLKKGRVHAENSATLRYPVHVVWGIVGLSSRVCTLRTTSRVMLLQRTLGSDKHSDPAWETRAWRARRVPELLPCMRRSWWNSCGSIPQSNDVYEAGSGHAMGPVAQTAPARSAEPSSHKVLNIQATKSHQSEALTPEAAEQQDHGASASAKSCGSARMTSTG